MKLDIPRGGDAVKGFRFAVGGLAMLVGVLHAASLVPLSPVIAGLGFIGLGLCLCLTASS